MAAAITPTSHVEASRSSHDDAWPSHGAAPGPPSPASPLPERNNDHRRRGSVCRSRPASLHFARSTCTGTGTHNLRYSLLSFEPFSTISFLCKHPAYIFLSKLRHFQPWLPRVNFVSAWVSFLFWKCERVFPSWLGMHAKFVKYVCFCCSGKDFLVLRQDSCCENLLLLLFVAMVV